MKKIFKKFLYKSKRALILANQYIIFLSQFKYFKKNPNPRFALSWRDRWVHLRDATSTTGFDRHYVYHTGWALRVINQVQPKEHVDISSSLYFVVSVSAIIPTRFIDYRPASLDLSGLHTEAGTLLKLPFKNNSIESLSCMHVVEHIGLGRYGDTIDYDGDIHAATELSRVLKVGGDLLFVVPVSGIARIQFNAHRIYTFNQVINLFPNLKLVEFALIPDNETDGGLIRFADPQLVTSQQYACGCFHFNKPNLN